MFSPRELRQAGPPPRPRRPQVPFSGSGREYFRPAERRTAFATPTIKLRTRTFCASFIISMRFLALAFFPAATLAAILAMSGVCAAGNISPHDCVAFAEASKHVGTNICVSGTVLHVENGRNGVKFLNFCRDSDKDKACPFTVVVFKADLKKMGDIGQLEGRQIEIKGTIQDYNGRAEIILRRPKQLGEGAFFLVPPVPTDYDVERAGHNSAGKISRPKAARKKSTKQGEPVSIEDPEEP